MSYWVLAPQGVNFKKHIHLLWKSVHFQMSKKGADSQHMVVIKNLQPAKLRCSCTCRKLWRHFNAKLHKKRWLISPKNLLWLLMPMQRKWRYGLPTSSECVIWGQSILTVFLNGRLYPTYQARGREGLNIVSQLSRLAQISSPEPSTS